MHFSLLSCIAACAAAAIYPMGALANDSETSMVRFERLERAAMAGDYQAQRNLAYWLSGGNGGAPPLDPVLSCAWRYVILASGNRQVDESDMSNKQLYCDKRLDAAARQAAKAKSEKLIKQIKFKK
jgi:hypothetical protein